MATYYGPQNPYGLAGYAARYSLDGAASDSTYLIDGSNGVKLIADKSGNSSANCLAFAGGVASNNTNTPDAAANRLLDNLCGILQLSRTSWSSATGEFTIFWKYGGAGNRSWALNIDTSGRPKLILSADGTASTTVTASAAPSFSAGSIGWIAFEWAKATGVVTFYTSSDGVTWTQLGTTGSALTGSSLFNSTANLEIYTGDAGIAGTNVFRAEIRSTISAATAQAFTPAIAGKLATSLVSATGETWTINTSGDIGARICGARDLVQMTAAKRPIFSTGADGKNIATFDGSNDYVQAATFPYVQPEMLYIIMSQVTWTTNESICSGTTGDMVIEQANGGVSPNIELYAGAESAEIAGPVIGERGLIRALFSAAASQLAINLNASTVVSAGSNNGNGFTVGAYHSGIVPSNITFSEALLRNVADSAYIQLRIAAYLMNKWSISF